MGFHKDGLGGPLADRHESRIIADWPGQSKGLVIAAAGAGDVLNATCEGHLDKWRPVDPIPPDTTSPRGEAIIVHLVAFAQPTCSLTDDLA